MNAVRFKSFQEFLTFGNSDVIAVESDWREVDGSLRCHAESTDGVSASLSDAAALFTGYTRNYKER